MQPVRTRFAPSPTGYLHVGGVRTALFAWLVARQSGGQFILRIEDTDKNREVAGSAAHIMESLGWLGLDWDEGPDKSGNYGPYLQSQRLNIYKEWGQKLIDRGRAYADPYSPAETQAFREQAQTARQPFLFRQHRPDNPPVWNGSQPLRFKAEPRDYTWHDAVMGDLSAGPEVIDDFVLIKSDGFPTYNFAHIVDDAEMAVTHVIRGQEFLASMPGYLNLYEALGLRPPLFATLPHVMAPGGQRKLSKRDGARDILDYKRDGYLPEALINFMASLGWNDGTEQEIFTVNELIKKFSLERIQKSGALFDEQRLLWMNGAHIRRLPLDDLYDKVHDFWPPEAAGAKPPYKKVVLGLVQERLKFFAELPALSRFFFVDLPVDPTLINQHKQLKNLPKQELKLLLEQSRAVLEQSDFTPKDLTSKLNQLLQDTGQKPAILFSLIRIATTQAPASPGLAETMAVLGRDRTLNRLSQQLSHL